MLLQDYYDTAFPCCILRLRKNMLKESFPYEHSQTALPERIESAVARIIGMGDLSLVAPGEDAETLNNFLVQVQYGDIEDVDVGVMAQIEDIIDKCEKTVEVDE